MPRWVSSSRKRERNTRRVALITAAQPAHPHHPGYWTSTAAATPGTSYSCEATNDRQPIERTESSVAYLQAPARKDPRDPGSGEAGEARIPVHASKSASHVSVRSPLTGAVTKLSSLEVAAWDLAVETNATTSSSRGQPTEDTRELTPARSTQVAEEDFRRPLRGLFGLGRLSGPEEKGKEEEHREEERRGTRLPICGHQALTRRYPGTDQSAWRRTPGPRINGPTPPSSKLPSPPTHITTPQHGW